MTKSYEWEKKIAKGVSSKYGKTAREKAYAVLRANGLSDEDYQKFAQKANNNKQLNAKPKLYQWEKDMASGISTKVASASRDRVDKMLLANGATKDTLPLIRKQLNQHEETNIANALKAEQDARAKAENDARLKDDGNRGFLDRTFDALSIGQYASANLVKAGLRDDYSAGQALSDAVKASNPFGKGYKKGEGTYSDVLKEVGWNPTSTAGKIARGTVGLAGDILLDPTTYLTLGGGAVAKGTGKVAIKATSQGLLKNMAEKYGVEALEQVKHIDDFIKLKPALKKVVNDDELRLLHRSIQFALNPRNIDNAKKLIRTQDAVRGVKKTDEELTKYAGQLVDKTLEASGVVKDGKASFGLSNAPFMKQLTRGASDKLTWEFSNKYVGKIGDALHISNTYNSARKHIMGSKITTLFSSKAKHFQDLQIAPTKLYDFIQMQTITKGLDARKVEDAEEIKKYAEDLLKLSPAESKQVIELMQDPAIFEPVKKLVQFADTEMFKSNKRQLRKELDTSKSKLARLQMSQGQISELEKKIAKTPSIDLEVELKKLTDARDAEIKSINLSKVKSEDARKLIIDNLYTDVEKMGEEGKVLKAKLDEHLANKPIIPDAPVNTFNKEMPKQPDLESLDGNLKITPEELSKLHEENKLRKGKYKPKKNEVDTYQLTKNEVVGRLNGMLLGDKIRHLESLGGNVKFNSISEFIPDEKIDELFRILNNPNKTLAENIKTAQGRVLSEINVFNGKNQRINSHVADKLGYKDFRQEIREPLEKTKEKLATAKNIKVQNALQNEVKRLEGISRNRDVLRGRLANMHPDTLEHYLSKKGKTGQSIEEILQEIEDVDVEVKRVNATETFQNDANSIVHKPYESPVDKYNLSVEKSPYDGITEQQKFVYAKEQFAKKVDEYNNLKGEINALESEHHNLLNPVKKEEIQVKIEENRAKIVDTDKKLNQLERQLEKRPELQERYDLYSKNLEILKKNRDILYARKEKLLAPDKEKVSELVGKITSKKKELDTLHSEIEGIDFGKKLDFRYRYNSKFKAGKTEQWIDAQHEYARQQIRAGALGKEGKGIESFNKKISMEYGLSYDASKKYDVEKMQEIGDYARDIIMNNYKEKFFWKLTPSQQKFVTDEAIRKYYSVHITGKNFDKFKESGAYGKLKGIVEKINAEKVVKQVEKEAIQPFKQTAEEKLLDTVKRARTARNSEVDKAYSKVHETFLDEKEKAQIMYEFNLSKWEKEVGNTSLSEWEEAHRQLSAQVDDVFKRQDEARAEIAKLKVMDEHTVLIDEANTRFETNKQKLLEETKQASIHEQQINEIKAEYATDVDALKRDISSLESQLNEVTKLRKEVMIKKNNLNGTDTKTLERLSKSNKILGTRYASMHEDDVLKELDEIEQHLTTYKTQFESRLARGFNMDEEIDKLTKRVAEIDKALVDDDALDAYLRNTYGEDKVVEEINRESKDYINKIVLDDMNVPEKVKEIVKELDKVFFDIGDKETMAGLLSPEQFKAMKHRYVTHVLTYEGRSLLKKKDIAKRFGVSGDMIGFGEEFNNFGLERTLVLPDGNGGFFKPTIQQANDFFAPMLKGKNFFSDVIGEIYLTRAMKHNELMYDNEYMKNMLHSFGDKVSFKSINNPPSGTKTVMNIGVLRENVALGAKEHLKNLRNQLNQNPMLSKFGSDELKRLLKTGMKYDDAYARVGQMIQQQLKASDKSDLAKALPTWEEALQVSLEKFGLDLKHIQDEAMPFVELSQQQARKIFAMLPDDVFHVSDTIVDKANQTRKFSIERDQKRFLQTYDKFVYWSKLMQTTVAPSFHVRNKLNNMFNAWLSGASGANKYNLQKDIWHLLKDEGKSTKEVLVNGGKVNLQDIYDLAVQHGVLDKNMFAKDFNAESAQQGILSFLPRDLDPTNTKGFVGFELGSKYGSRIENQDRLAQFISHLNQGLSPEESADLVNKFLFDYSDVTLFEQRIMKRIFPYYTFMKKNSMLQLQNLIERPEKMALVAKVMRSPEGMVDDKDKINRNYVAKFAKTWVQLPFNSSGIDPVSGKPTVEPVLMNPNMSFMALDELPNPAHLVDTATNYLSKTTMPIKSAIEMTTNKNFFLDTAIAPLSFENPDGVGTEKGKMKRDWVKSAKDYLSYLAHQNAPVTQIDDAISKSGTDFKLQLANMGGLKMLSYDYEMAKRKALNQEKYESGQMSASEKESYERYIKPNASYIDKPLNSIRNNTDFDKIKEKYYSHVEGVASVTNKWLTNQTLTEKEKDKYKPFISILRTFGKDEAKSKQFVGALFQSTSLDKILLNKDFVKARVTKVLDGDTVQIMYNGKKESVRMLLIDTPEIAHKPGEVAMPQGNEARDVAKTLLDGKDVQLVVSKDRDVHGRLLAYLAVDGKDYNNYLLSQGLAGVRYSKQAQNKGNAMNLNDYKATQKSAYQKKLGIWGVNDYANINTLDEKGFNHDKEYYRKEALKRRVKK